MKMTTKFAAEFIGRFWLVLVGIAAAGIFYIIVSGKSDFNGIGDFATNGYGEHSTDGFNMMAVLVTEVVMTFMFLIITLGAIDKRAPSGFAAKQK